MLVNIEALLHKMNPEELRGGDHMLIEIYNNEHTDMLRCSGPIEQDIIYLLSEYGVDLDLDLFNEIRTTVSMTEPVGSIENYTVIEATSSVSFIKQKELHEFGFSFYTSDGRFYLPCSIICSPDDDVIIIVQNDTYKMEWFTYSNDHQERHNKIRIGKGFDSFIQDYLEQCEDLERMGAF